MSGEGWKKEKTKQQLEIAEVISTELILEIKELARKLRQELEYYVLDRTLLWGWVPTSKCTIQPTNDDSLLSAEENICLEYL